MALGVVLRLSATTLLLGFFLPAHATVNYANDFIDPTIVLSGSLNYTTGYAQQTVLLWAKQLAASGPWCTTNHLGFRWGRIQLMP